MKSVSIYALTRKQNLSNLSRLECHLSERDRPLKMRVWEINSMRALVDQLEKYMPEVYRLRLFYSFQILRLGKEFDLLQVKENQIVNIELKSGAVSEDAIRRQLIQKPVLSGDSWKTGSVLYLYKQSEPPGPSDES